MEVFDARGVLSAIPLFAETMDDKQMTYLAGHCRLSIYPDGTSLMTEGDFGDALFAIVEGRVEVSFKDKHGGKHKVTILKPGEIVGEMSLLTGQRRSATAVAEGEVAALEIGKVTFEELFNRAPELIDRFSEVLSRRQADLERRTAAAEASAEAIGARIRRFFQRG